MDPVFLRGMSPHTPKVCALIAGSMGAVCPPHWDPGGQYREIKMGNDTR